MISKRTALPLILAAAITCTPAALAKKQKKDKKAQETVQTQTVTRIVEVAKPYSGPAPVLNPTVPRKLTIFGETVDLDPAYNAERLDRELTAVTYTHGNTLLTIKRANRYFPMMAPILREGGIPEDMLYLACTESMLNPRALSGAKAAGIWQFMPDTGRQYGLEVNDYVDERYHPVKATEAAVKYLRNAYKRYGSWVSAASSYNAGMGRISNELASQQVGTSLDLWLVDETTRYPFRIMAYKLIMENPDAYGFALSPEQLYQPLDYRTVEVDYPVDDWSVWARSQGVTYRDLREANPWIRAKSLPNKDGKTYQVLVPVKDHNLRSKMKPQVYNKAWTK